MDEQRDEGGAEQAGPPVPPAPSAPAPPPSYPPPSWGPPLPAHPPPSYPPPAYPPGAWGPPPPAYPPPPYGAYPPGVPGWGGYPVPHQPPPPRRRHFTLPWLTLFVAVAVLLADIAVVAARMVSGPGSDLPRSVAVEKRVVTESPRDAERRAGDRDRAIEAMFDRRATAVTKRDEAAFLADIDPEQRAFLGKQREVFTSLRKLEFSHWSYEPQDASYSPGSIDYARYGDADDLWLPVLILRYRLKGFDAAPVGRRIVYTVVQRDGRWYIGGDADLEDITSSGTSVRVDPWENGPIVVERGPHGIVIGHPDDRAAITAIRREVEDAVRHVTAYVGRKSWNRKVVVVLPTDDEELDRILENPTTFFDFAAVARPLLTIPADDDEARQIAGSRVVINPEGFDAKSDFTTHLIRHEITHVALFERIGDDTPKWLIEGVAEYVGNAGSDLPPEALAAELAIEIGKSGVPQILPTDSDFGLINDAGIAYNSAWLLCRYIASEYGRAALFKFHDEMGTYRSSDKPGRKFDDTLRRTLRTDEKTLLAGWRAYVRAAVGDLSKMLVNPGGAYKEDDRGRLTVKDLARQKGLDAKRLTAAGVERAAAAFWVEGPASRPRRRLIQTLVVAETEAGAAAAERQFTDRLRPFDASGRPIPNGRIFYVGTTIGGTHYNETIAVVRAGTVVIEIRVAVPGAGDSSGETRRVAAAQYAAVD